VLSEKSKINSTRYCGLNKVEFQFIERDLKRGKMYFPYHNAKQHIAKIIKETKPNID
jgi:hypothetical protein